jgi:hypothetical protein
MAFEPFNGMWETAASADLRLPKTKLERSSYLVIRPYPPKRSNPTEL